MPHDSLKGMDLGLTVFVPRTRHTFYENRSRLTGRGNERRRIKGTVCGTKFKSVTQNEIVRQYRNPMAPIRCCGQS